MSVLLNSLCVLWVLSSSLVILSANPLYSVLSLVLSFFHASGVLLILGHEYLAAVFIVLYAGAMCTFFIFVIMILDIKVEEIKSSMSKYVPLNVLILVLGVNVTKHLLGLNDGLQKVGVGVLPCDMMYLDETTEIYSLGVVLYNDFGLLLILAGLLLLCGMIGSVALTLRQSKIGRNHKDVSVTNRRSWTTSVYGNK